VAALAQSAASGLSSDALRSQADGSVSSLGRGTAGRCRGPPRLGARPGRVPLGFAGLWTSAGSLRLAAGRPLEALPLLDEAERRGDDVALLRAQALSALGKQREAVQTLEAALVRRPQDAELGFALAGQWLAAGRPALARQALDRLRPFLSGAPTRVRLLTTEAETYRVEGRLGRALESLDTALRLSPENAGLQYQAAQLYEQLGRFDAAAEAVRAGELAEGPSGAARAQAWLVPRQGCLRPEAEGAGDSA